MRNQRIYESGAKRGREEDVVLVFQCFKENVAASILNTTEAASVNAKVIVVDGNALDVAVVEANRILPRKSLRKCMLLALPKRLLKPQWWLVISRTW